MQQLTASVGLQNCSPFAVATFLRSAGFAPDS
jgi:hypothetical protein